MTDQQCQKTASLCCLSCGGLFVECHSHILCSHCGTSLLTLTSSTLNSISIRQCRGPWWFALMSLSISFCQPKGTLRSAAHRNQTMSCYLESHRAERLIQFEHHIWYSRHLFYPAVEPSGTLRKHDEYQKV